MINCQFNDFDLFTESVQNWDLELRLLSKGVFSSTLFQANVQDLLFAYTDFNVHFEQLGSAPKGMRTLVIPASENQFFRWRNHLITPDTVAIFPKNNELHAVSDSKFNIFGISLPLTLLNTLDPKYASPLLNTFQGTAEVLQANSTVIQAIRIYLHHLKREILKANSSPLPPKTAKMIRIELLDQLIHLFNNSSPIPAPPSKIRDQAIKTAISYINDSDGELTTVAELCNVTGASARTLQYAFMDYFQISPKQYLKRYHLNRARKELTTMCFSDSTINDIANKWGFWHMGQFAADYRKLFGELPSETLNR